MGADDVRDVINVSAEDIPDAKVLKMIKRAEVTLELETREEIDYSSCTDAQKEFITVLAAIYTICFLTGGSAVGLSFSVRASLTQLKKRRFSVNLNSNQSIQILRGYI